MANAHMSLWYPGPLGGVKEANAFSPRPDPQLNFPLGCCDKDGGPTLLDPGLCRGHLDLFDREEPQVVWTAGQEAYFQLSDYTYSSNAQGSTHDGGSCQVGFSVDRGLTWKAAASFFGNCPRRGGDGSPEFQTFDFGVPLGVPEGNALFVWVWLNREHESYVNCAKVRIGSGQNNKISTLRPLKASQTPVTLDSSKVSKTPLQPRKNFGTNEQPLQRRLSDVCRWDSAPIMETSYFTVDAKCMPGAKLSNSRSDDFEYGWDVSCGVIHGDNAYTIRTIECDATYRADSVRQI
ncbi:hypothetical protein BKA66DRAFT_566987 [Pyrenochaeta sp. MPI-SDFR-AT-0127]|nr:hypothetical protein BKA66DRAFT_566987 [Pyrenochaeta sp. MPI-SDFR-AT-0127]